MNSLKSNNKSDKQIKNVDGLTTNQRRDVVLSELKRKSKIRTIFKDCEASEIKEILDRIESVFEEKYAEETLKKQNHEKMQERAQSILSEMEEKGIDMELLQELQFKKDSLSVPPPKVKYMKDGASWSGLGRRPTPFKGLSDYELEKYRKLKD
ncbi:MAG: DNA-binding protein [Rheinheimera sp.]|uniref:DNA-binding protein n=1 Tax=Pseudoalteromonas agarivorans TaxID=176102 RepID=A0AAD0XDS3_9GAMM|nr:H-NS family nucleoid-associated regulatory protein [Pseudoalteromonas agarivorans]AYM89021.1 DNA-binding protein [Pseudoalteromonas agarivorans]MAD75043.1 DNA-binding protein [Rheinheimera sp.]|tara:strand:- start:2441 stop:2899 length:459 start_codon:yes stop_codon:yes gene_type:complete